MNKEQLIKTMAESIGAVDKEVKTAFDIFLKRMSELLDLNQSIRIPEIGIFQLKKRSAIRQERREAQQTKNVAESYYLLFVPLHYNKTAPNEILAFRVPEKKKNDPVAVEDTAFSLSYGKPVIPLNEAQRREFMVQSSYLLLQKSLEQKVERLLAGAIHLNDFNIDYRQVILEDDERNESFDIRKELDETADGGNETVEWDFGQNPDDILDNEFTSVDTESPAGEFSPDTAEETIPGETFPLKAEDESFTFDMDNPEFKSELTEDIDMLAEDMLLGSTETPSSSFPEPEEEPAQPFMTEVDKGSGAADTEDTEDLLSRIVWEPEEENISDSYDTQSGDDLSGNDTESSPIISDSDAGEFKFEDFNFEEFNRDETFNNQAEDDQVVDENEVLGDEPVIPEEETEEEPEEFNADRFNDSIEEAKPSESLPELEEEFEEDKREGLSPLFWGILIVLVLVTSAGIYYFMFSDRSGKTTASGAAAGSAEKAQIIERNYDVPVSYIPDEKPESNTADQAADRNEGTVTENINTAAPNKAEENRTSDNKTADNKAIAENKPAAAEKKDVSEGIFRNDKKDQMVQSQIFSDGSRYTVQLSSWKQRSVAEKEARRLRSAGYDAYVATYSPNSSTKWYRVRIGNYASVNEAENVLRKVK